VPPLAPLATPLLKYLRKSNLHKNVKGPGPQIKSGSQSLPVPPPTGLEKSLGSYGAGLGSRIN